MPKTQIINASIALLIFIYGSYFYATLPIKVIHNGQCQKVLTYKGIEIPNGCDLPITRYHAQY